MARNAFLGRTHEIDGLKPIMHGNVARLKDGADSYAERLAARLRSNDDVEYVEPDLRHVAFELPGIFNGQKVAANEGNATLDLTPLQRVGDAREATA